MASFWGPRSGLGLAIAIIAFLTDLLSKIYLLNLLNERFPPRLAVTPFFDLVLSWNRGISYGIFSSDHWAAQPALIALGLGVLFGLWLWLAHSRGWVVAVAFGLIIGGALGNLCDRIRFGAVADFFSFHAWGFYWYIFNIADVWIVLGGGVLICETVLGSNGQGDVRKQMSNGEAGKIGE